MNSRRSMDFHILAWTICGYWTLSPSYPRLSRVYSVLMLTLFYILFPLGMFIKLFSIDDIAELLATIVFLLTASCGIKMWLIMRKLPLALQLISMMDNMDEHIDCDEYRNLRDNAVKRARMLTTVLAGTYFSTTAFLYSAALLSPDRVLIWSFWFPFDYRRNLVVYHLSLLYQVLGTLAAAVANSSFDSYSGSLYLVLGSHFEVIGLRMAQLGRHQSTEGVAVTTRRNLAIQNSAKTEKDFKYCIDMHLHLIRFSSLVDQLLSLLNMIQFGISGVTLCAAEFQLSLIDPIGQRAAFLAMLMYLLCLTMQIYVPCWCASKVTEMSDRLAMCIFDSNWMDQSQRFKSSMLIFVERAIKPILPMAGGLFEIGLPMFVSIMKTGYSLFAFMKKLE